MWTGSTMAQIFKDCLFTTERGQVSEPVSAQSRKGIGFDKPGIGENL